MGAFRAVLKRHHQRQHCQRCWPWWLAAERRVVASDSSSFSSRRRAFRITRRGFVRRDTLFYNIMFFAWFFTSTPCGLCRVLLGEFGVARRGVSGAGVGYARGLRSFRHSGFFQRHRPHLSCAPNPSVQRTRASRPACFLLRLGRAPLTLAVGQRRQGREN